MSSTPNAFEVQIDNFLGQFRRSTSKAMDTDWVTSQTATSTTGTRPIAGGGSMGNRKRNSCIDISELSLTGEHNIQFNMHINIELHEVQAHWGRNM